MRVLAKVKLKAIILSVPDQTTQTAGEQAWLAAAPPPEPTVFALTPKIEAELQRWGNALATTPDDQLYDGIILPQPPTLPNRWTSEEKP